MSTQIVNLFKLKIAYIAKIACIANIIAITINVCD